MDVLQASKLRFAIIFLMITALVFTGVGLPTPGDSLLAPEAWAGGDDDDDDDDDDDGDKGNKGNNGKHKGHMKDFDHFACYNAASHEVGKDVKIINQFTTDEHGKTVMVPISVGELVLLCVPTMKIHLDDHGGKKPHKKK